MNKNKFQDGQKEALKNYIKSNKLTSLELTRARIIIALMEGLSIEIITSIFGHEKSYICKLKKDFLSYSYEIFKYKNKNYKSLLLKAQKEEVKLKLYDNIKKKIFWTAAQLADFISEKYNVVYKSYTSLYVLFKEIRFSCHKPGKCYKNYNKDTVNQWKIDNQKQFEEFIKDESVTILTEDEMILTSRTTMQKVWLPINEYPLITDENTRKRKVIFGFLNLKTKEAIAFKKDTGNGIFCLEVLKEIHKKYAHKKKIVIYWDGARYHFTQEIKEFLGTVDNILLIKFAPYAPKENPTEMIWKEARKSITHNKNIDDIDKFSDQLIEYVNTRQFNYTISWKPVS